LARLDVVVLLLQQVDRPHVATLPNAAASSSTVET